DGIGRYFLPLVESGFADRAALQPLVQAGSGAFTGIAGSHRSMAAGLGVDSQSIPHGWMVWYRGQVQPPSPGSYRFWGYADNHLLISIDGKAVFEGSRYDSPFKQLGIPRTDHPSLPCLNAMAGFASGPWIQLDGLPVQLDILFGELSRNLTSGLLLVEREGEKYEDTYWGQPKWPLFLTAPPTEDQITELENLRKQMESKLLGSFSLPTSHRWRVVGS
ncbi:MAG: hypothetical protein AAF191_20385, partial [Verrucomicrobiota bacterium]